MTPAGMAPPGVFVFPFSKGRGLADLSGLGDAPPILSFSGPRKRENAPCTVEERKRGWCQTACGCLAHMRGLTFAQCGCGNRPAALRAGKCFPERLRSREDGALQSRGWLSNGVSSFTAAAGLEVSGKHPPAAAKRGGRAIRQPPSDKQGTSLAGAQFCKEGVRRVEPQGNSEKGTARRRTPVK